ncbi:MAG: GNAT family N-acetyltransferase [Burkholderiales bacterium]|nr:GNAT family N-acetyltransferase [Burkholderiales bacterium]
MSETFLYTQPHDPAARPLIEALTREYDTRYGDIPRAEGEPKEMDRYPPEVFAPPHGNFVLLLRDGVAIGGGAFMRLDPHTAEFKRIWTHAELRRQGLARKIMVELEAQAVRQGYSRGYLTTGFRQPEAVALYLGHGYTPLFDLAQDPATIGSLPFQKLLVPSAKVEFQEIVVKRSDLLQGVLALRGAAALEGAVAP